MSTEVQPGQTHTTSDGVTVKNTAVQGGKPIVVVTVTYSDKTHSHVHSLVKFPSQGAGSVTGLNAGDIVKVPMKTVATLGANGCTQLNIEGSGNTVTVNGNGNTVNVSPTNQANTVFVNGNNNEVDMNSSQVNVTMNGTGNTVHN